MTPPSWSFFQKIIRFSGATRPLMSKMQKNTSGPIIPHSFLVMCFCSILVYRQKKGFTSGFDHWGAVNNHFLVHGAIFCKVRPKRPTNNLLGDPRASLLFTSEQAVFQMQKYKIQNFKHVKFKVQKYKCVNWKAWETSTADDYKLPPQNRLLPQKGVTDPHNVVRFCTQVHYCAFFQHSN